MDSPLQMRPELYRSDVRRRCGAGRFQLNYIWKTLVRSELIGTQLYLSVFDVGDGLASVATRQTLVLSVLKLNTLLITSPKVKLDVTSPWSLCQEQFSKYDAKIHAPRHGITGEIGLTISGKALVYQEAVATMTVFAAVYKMIHEIKIKRRFLRRERKVYKKHNKKYQNI